MTIPVPKTYPNGIGVTHPNNRYSFEDIPEGGIELLPGDHNEQDPQVLLSAQLRNSLHVTTGREFTTNVPEPVYKDFNARAHQWNEYVEQGGWKNFQQSNHLIAKMVANSIKQEYTTLARVGQEEKSMFGLESIVLHLRDLISMETFFSSLFE